MKKLKFKTILKQIAAAITSWLTIFSVLIPSFSAVSAATLGMKYTVLEKITYSNGRYSYDGMGKMWLNGQWATCVEPVVTTEDGNEYVVETTIQNAPVLRKSDLSPAYSVSWDSKDKLEVNVWVLNNPGRAKELINALPESIASSYDKSELGSYLDHLMTDGDILWGTAQFFSWWTTSDYSSETMRFVTGVTGGAGFTKTFNQSWNNQRYWYRGAAKKGFQMWDSIMLLITQAMRTDNGAGGKIVEKTGDGAIWRGANNWGIQRLATPQNLNYNVNAPKGAIEIFKTGTNGENVSGVTYQIRKASDGSVAYTWTTNGDGWAGAPNIPFGDYDVVEISAPDGYQVDSTPHRITVNQAYEAGNNATSAVVRLTNKYSGAFQLWKKGPNGKLLPNAEFAIYKVGNDATPVYTMTTNGDGWLGRGEVQFGDYYAVETKAPDGYRLDTTKHFFTVNQNWVNSETIATVNVSNDYVRGTISLEKTDSQTGEELQGVVFKLVNLDGSDVDSTVVANATATTDSYGLAKWEDVKTGSYKVVEVSTLKSHRLLSIESSPSVTVTADGTQNLEVTNQKISEKVTINKVDELTGTAIEGVEFELVQTNRIANNKYDEFTTAKSKTNAQGIVEFDNVPVGEYTVREVAVPKGYVAEPYNKAFTISQETVGKPFDFKATNKAQVGRVTLTKRDVETKAGLQGSTFDVVQVSSVNGTNQDGAVIQTVTSGQDGTVVIDNLPLGVYDIVEKSTDAQHTVNKVAIRISVLADEVGGVYTTNVTQNSTNGSSLVDLYNEKATELKAESKADVKTFEAITEEKASGDNAAINFYNLGVYGRITLNKQSNEGENKATDLQPEANIAFGVYAADGSKVATITTNSEGNAYSDWLRPGVYTVKQETHNTGYIDVADFNVEILGGSENAWKTYNYALENKAMRVWLQIVKKDAETGKTVLQSGVSFELYKADGTKVEQEVEENGVKVTKSIFTTDAEGIVKLPNTVKVGEYTIKEVKAPTGYYLDPNGEPIKISIAETNELNTVTITEVVNTPQKGQLTLNKRADLVTGVEEVDGITSVVYKEGYLSGTQWQLIAKETIMSYDKQTTLYNAGDVVATITTTADGGDKSPEVPLGKYILKEVSTPKQYVLDTKEYDVEFTAQAQEVRVDSKSENKFNVRKSAKFEFTKTFVESEYFTHAKEATFGLYTKSAYTEGDVTIPADTLIGKTTVKVAGNKANEVIKGEFKDIIIDGDVYVKEISTSDAYVLNGEKYEATVNFATQTDKAQTVTVVKPIVNTLKEMSLKVTKVEMGSNSEIKVAGATYRLVSVDEAKGEKTIGEYVTDKDGVLEVTGLNVGTYYLEEVKAPEGYLINANKEFVKIDGTNEHGAVITHETEDEKIVEISTKATTERGTKVGYEYEKHIEVATMESLVVGKEYEVIVKQYNGKDGSVLSTQTRKFTAVSREQVETFEFTVPKDFEGYIVYGEDLYRDGRKVGYHYDLTNKDQTVEVRKPVISTQATTENGEKVGFAYEKHIEVATLSNLVVGDVYNVVATQYDSNGKVYATQEREVTATDVEMVVNFEFTVPDGFEGNIVYGEDLQHGKNKNVVANHYDLTNEKQTVTVKVPKVNTQATTEDGHKTGYAFEKHVEVATMEDLIVGRTYKVVATQYDTTGKELAKQEREFKATETTHVEEFEFTVPANFVGKIVYGEDLYENGNKVAVHYDLDNDKQTVVVREPKIVTQAHVDGNKVSFTQGQKVAISDTLTYSDFRNEQVLVKTWVVKYGTDEKVSEVYERVVTLNENGELVVDLTGFDTSKLATGKYTLMEQIFLVKDGKPTDKLISEHTDNKDDRQSFTVVEKPVEDLPNTASADEPTRTILLSVAVLVILVSGAYWLVGSRKRKDEETEN